jgi:hypothetical protein
MPKMIVRAVYTMTNNNKQRTMNYAKQTQTKPIYSELACLELVEEVEPISNRRFWQGGNPLKILKIFTVQHLTNKRN